MMTMRKQPPASTPVEAKLGGIVLGGDPRPRRFMRLPQNVRARVLIFAAAGLLLLIIFGAVWWQQMDKPITEVATDSPAATADPQSAPAPADADAVPDADKPDVAGVQPLAPATPAGGSSSDGTPTAPGGGTNSCALPKYPDASCTGVPTGTSLTVLNGDQTISIANTVIENKDIRGCVTVNASGVVIRNSKITADCFYVIYRHSNDGTTLVIEDSEISCGNNNGTAIGDTGITVRRSNIYGCENGFDVDSDVTIEDSYIHNLTQDGADPHTDGIQITPAGNNVTIRHNTIYAFTGSANGTSAIITPSSAISNILIQDNLVAGGAYTLYCRPGGSHNNFKVINNRFSTVYGSHVGEYGSWTDCDDETQVTGNVYHQSGLPVPF